MTYLRKKRPLEREKGVHRDARLVVLAVEGKTEESYFTHIRELLRKPSIQIYIVGTSGGKSAPTHVLENIKDFMDRHDIGPDDSFWLVIDKDHHRTEAIKSLVTKLKKGKRGVKIEAAISVPRFEVWLLLHFTDEIRDPGAKNSLEKQLRRFLPGYRHGPIKSLEKITRDRIDHAMKHAPALDSEPENPDPDPPCTRVYLPMREILTPRGGR
ncbi:MAG: RloB domain-containing protein [Candidatus Sumerlaeia bacterium]|nr:RloB domain-containing protein [Candidatus Sumerlaeia bacterium]